MVVVVATPSFLCHESVSEFMRHAGAEKKEGATRRTALQTTSFLENNCSFPASFLPHPDSGVDPTVCERERERERERGGQAERQAHFLEEGGLDPALHISHHQAISGDGGGRRAWLGGATGAVAPPPHAAKLVPFRVDEHLMKVGTPIF